MKLKRKLIATLLAVTQIFAAVTFNQTTATAALTSQGSTSNYAFMTPETQLTFGEETSTDNTFKIHPEMQYLRCTIIRNDTTNPGSIPNDIAIKPRCGIDGADEIIRNPVNLANSYAYENIKDNTYGSSLLGDDELYQVFNYNVQDSAGKNYATNDRYKYTRMVPNIGIEGNVHVDDTRTNQLPLSFGGVRVSGTWLVDVSDVSEHYLKTEQAPVFKDDSIPTFFGTNLECPVKQRTPSKPQWASMSNQEYFADMAQSMTMPSKDVDGVGEVEQPTQAINIFAYRVLGKAIGVAEKQMYTDPRLPELYEKLFGGANPKCSILVEPCIVLENLQPAVGHSDDNDKSSNAFAKLFGSVKWIGLSAGDMGICSDVFSGINYGYTSPNMRGYFFKEGADGTTSKSNGTTYRIMYNFMLHDPSVRSDIMKFYESMILNQRENFSNGEPMFYAIPDESAQICLEDLLKNDRVEADASADPKNRNTYFWASHWGSVFDRPDPKPGPFWNRIAYVTQMYSITARPNPARTEANPTSFYDMLSDMAKYIGESNYVSQAQYKIGIDQNGGTINASEYDLNNQGTDPASLVEFGAITIVHPKQDFKVDYTITAKSEGEFEQAGTWSFENGEVADGNLYYDAYDSDTNSFKLNVRSLLNMEATSWQTDLLTTAPVNYRTSSESNSEDYPLQDDPAILGDNNTYVVKAPTGDDTEVYIPAKTTTMFSCTYVDEDGVPCEYAQTDGTTGNGNTAIVAGPTGMNSEDMIKTKLFLNNVNYYGFNPQTKEAIPYDMSVDSATDRMGEDIEIKNTPERTDYIKDGGGDTTSGEKWMTITLSDKEERPENAKYVRVKATINLNPWRTHNETAESITGNPATFSKRVSRPSKYPPTSEEGTEYKAVAYMPQDGEGNPKNTNPEAEENKKIGSVEENYDNNTVVIYIPLKQYDLSADTVDINYDWAPEISATNPNVIGSLSINTTSSATPDTISDYINKTTQEKMYVYVTDFDPGISNYIAEQRTKEHISGVDEIEYVSGFDNNSEISALGIPTAITPPPTSDKLIAPDITADEVAMTSSEVDGTEIDTLNWDIDSTKDPTNTQKVLTEVNRRLQEKDVYVTAVLLINHPTSAPKPMTPEDEQIWVNNVQAQTVCIPHIDPETNAPPQSTFELDCLPRPSTTTNTGDPSIPDSKPGNAKTLSEYNNFDCLTADTLLSQGSGGYGTTKSNVKGYVQKNGITEACLTTQTSLSAALNHELYYGANVSVDGVPNDSPLGRRTKIKYEKGGRYYQSRCNRHAPGTELRKYTSHDAWNGPFDGGKDKKIMPQYIFKYLAFDDNENRFYIENQVVNSFYITTGRNYCTHTSGRKTYRVVKQSWYDVYTIADTQDKVSFSIIFDKNYGQNIHNSMVYSIESLLANTKDQGKYSYIIQAGEPFGINNQVRLITDIPGDKWGATIRSDVYYTYQNTAGNGSFPMNNYANMAELQLIDYSPKKDSGSDRSRILLFDDYANTAGRGGISAWTKSNDSYNQFLEPPAAIDRAPYTTYQSSSGKKKAVLNAPNDYKTGSVDSSKWNLYKVVNEEDKYRLFSFDETPGKYWGIQKLGSDGKEARLTPGGRRWTYYVSARNTTETEEYINIHYYRFQPKISKELGNVRGLRTNPDYPDSIKINSSGVPIITNKEAQDLFINGNSITNFEKAMGYVGQRVNCLTYFTDITYDGTPVKLHGRNYNIGNELIGTCSNFSLVVAGSVNNRYTAHENR